MVCYLDIAIKLEIVISKVECLDDSHVILLVSKEAFSLLSMSTMAAVGMDIKVYRHSQVLTGGFFLVK